ncbi:MAG: hypothetical protein D8M59_05165 [Planctomycetes bacterium]|nr:hypothetical protein [Planctomycetota bacterium]
MTALEFLLAISITALIALATGSLLLAVAQSSDYDRYMREFVVRSQALSVRLSSYILPSLCILETGASTMVLWLDDSTASETVHVSELRWVDHDPVSKTVRLYYISFPDTWSEAERSLYDIELPAASDWWAVLDSYKTLGYIESTRLSDAVTSFTIERSVGTERDKRIATFVVQFDAKTNNQTAVFESSVREYKEPIS